MGRIHDDNICWVCCCCGCLPIIGFIKGVIVVGPIVILSLFGIEGSALILLPHDIFLTYKALIKTSLIGINLKILGILLLPIALVSWPILVAFGSILFGIIFGLFYPVVLTFDEDFNIFGGFVETFKETCNIIKKFWKFNYHSYFSYLHDIENKECDDPFDINIIQIIIGVILAGYGSVVGTIIFILMWIIKVFPSIFKMYHEMFKAYCDLKCLEIFMYLIFFIIGLSLVPVVGVLSILVYIGFGLYGGILCAIEGYKYNIGRGIISIWDTIHLGDSQSNELIFGRRTSCFPDCSDTCKTKKEKNLKKKKEKKEKNDSNEENISNNKTDPEIIVEKPNENEKEKETQIKEESASENKIENEIKEENSPKNEVPEIKETLLSNEQTGS